MKSEVIVQIGDDFYCFRYRDPGVLRPEDKGMWRCHRVMQDWTGRWCCCDDDDYLIDDAGRIVAREIGWGLRREELK